MIKKLLKILFPLILVLLVLQTASLAVSITQINHLSYIHPVLYDYAHATIKALNVSEIRMYTYVDIEGSFTDLDVRPIVTGADEALIDNGTYGVIVNGVTIPSANFWYWDADHIAFYVPEGIDVGANIDIQVIDNGSATYNVDFSPPPQVTINSLTNNGTTVTVNWSVSDALNQGGYTASLGYNCGILVVRSESAPLDAGDYPVDGSSYSPPAGSAVVFNAQGTSCNESTPPDGYMYYYQTFIHDGTPNYNRDIEYTALNLQLLITDIYDAYPSGNPTTQAGPEDTIYIKGVGFDGTGGSRQLDMYEDGHLGDPAYLVWPSFIPGDAYIGTGWWVTNEYAENEVAHITLEIPSVADGWTYYGLVDILLTNADGNTVTFEDFEISGGGGPSNPPVISTVKDYTGAATTEGKVGSYVQLDGTYFGATDVDLVSVSVGGFSLSPGDPGYEWYSSTTIGIHLDQGVKSGDIVVTTVDGSDSWSSYTILPPSQLYYFNATAGDGENSLAWTNPSEDAFSGVMIVRSDASISWIPTDENTSYSVGDEPTTGVHVIYKGSGASSTDTGLTNGTTYYYRAYTYDDAGHYNTETINATDNATPATGATSPNIDHFENAVPAITTEARVGDYLGIHGTNLGGSTSTVYIGGVLAAFEPSASQNDFYLGIIVPSGVAEGLQSVEVRDSLGNSGTDTITIVAGTGPGPITTPEATALIIDDYEGTLVDPASYYAFDAGTSQPTYSIQGATVYEGSNAIEILYTYQNTGPGDWGGGIGGVLSSSLDISSADVIKLMVKGDGSANSVRIDLLDADDGEAWSSPAIPLSGTDWQEVTVSLDDFTLNVFGATGDGVFSKVIGQYQLIYVTTSTSANYHYVDYIIATSESTVVTANTPVITSVNPTQAVVGSVVTINGYNFGNTQMDSEVQLDGTSVGAVITAWSDTQIVFTLPETFAYGTYDLQVYRKDTTLGIDEFSTATPFAVIAMATKAKVYPNPFNPLAGSVKIQVSVTEMTAVDLYLYDMVGRMVYQETARVLPIGTSEIEWNGRDYTGLVAGDGVYLVRIIRSDTKELLFKGKILVIKRN